MHPSRYPFNKSCFPRYARQWVLFCTVFVYALRSVAQDSSFHMAGKVVTLKEVVVRNNLNVPKFIERVKNDSSFYKAFRNLKVLGYTALNDIRMMDKYGEVIASLSSRTRQFTAHGCRWMQTIDQHTEGNMFNREGEWKYYTAELYAGLFFTRDTVCGETNIVSGTSFGTNGKSGIAKHKEQLKMLFFNPGKKIPGIPFIGDKIALFDDDVARLYDFSIDMQELHGDMCYVFSIKAREDLTPAEKDRTVINEMTTWFEISNWDILSRHYDLSYNAGIYDFNVQMEVELSRFGDYLVPSLIRYNGDWGVLFKKREKSVFTATLFDFSL